MTASIEKSSTQGFRKQKNKIVIRHSLKADMNPSIPDEGEIVFATDTKDLLIGDGINKVQDLSPINGGGANLPEQTGHAGEFLTTDGSEVSWSDLPQADWNQSDTSAPDYIKNKPYIPEGVVVDQTYDPTSTNAQSGTAVAEAVSSVDTALDTHIADKNNPHEVTKAQVGLGNVDNTADIDKPISTATQTALDNKVTKNVDITSATKCKITYDSKGLVTTGADLEVSDIPDISTIYQTKLTESNKLSTDYISGLANVAKTGDYGDLANKPTIPAAQVNSDWNANSGIAQILNKPTLSVVATSGDYNDLLNKPYIPAGVIVDQTYSPTSTNAQAGIAVAQAVADKVDANTAITGGTATKITYDSKGLVTAGADLAESDIPALHLSKISDVTASATELNYIDGVTSNIQTQLNNKVSKSGDSMINNLEMTDGSVYLEGIGSSVSGSTSKLVLGTPNNKYAYLTGNNQGAFGIYSETSGTRKGIACYPNQNFFADATTKTIDLGRSNNVWKIGYIDTLSDGTNSISIANIIAKQDALVSGTNIKTINSQSILGSGDLTVDGLPSQTGQSGKFLTTNGTDASWATVPSGGATITLRDWSI